MKEVKVVVRDLRTEISEELIKSYEKEFLEMKMKEIKQEKVEELMMKRIKLEAEQDFLFTYEKEPKMPKKEILRMEFKDRGNGCKTITKHQCEICQKYFASKDGLKRHKERHFKTQNFPEIPCKKCDKTFKTTHNYDVHVCINNLMCPHCDVKLKDTNFLKLHLLKIHGIDLNKFFCDYCGRGFTGLEYLKNHLTRGNCRKLRDPYSCDHCGKTFTHKGLLRNHVLVHSKYEIECKFCQEKMRPASLSNHMWAFHPKTDENFKCQFCSKNLKSSRVLKRHLKVHNKKFQCEKCPRRFATLASLNLHLKIHNNPEQFQCKVCRKNCATNQNLKIHMKVHELKRSKDLKCKRCDYKTDQVQNLKKHLKYHERLDKKLKENPNAIKCEKCPTVVLSLHSYLRHMKEKHGNGPKFQCDFCEYSTIHKFDLLRHFSTKHNRFL